MKKLNYETKDYLVNLAGHCFWYWNDFYSFLDSCQIPKKLYQRYPKELNKFGIMRNILEDLEFSNNYSLIKELISGFFKLNKPATDVKDPQKAKKLLDDFKKHVGNDPIEYELEKREIEAKKEDYKKNLEDLNNQRQKIENLKSELINLIGDATLTSQQKGFKLEDIFFQLLNIEEFNYTLPFRNDTQQIDGIFKYESFDYLVEIKFQNEQIKEKELSIFKHKIDGKAQSTRGLFLSMNDFDKEHIKAFEGNSPKIILMTGQELFFILDQRRSFFDVMQKKSHELVKTGKILFELGL